MLSQFVNRLVLLACILLTVASCSSSSKKELKPVELHDFTEEVDVEKLWSKSVGSGLGEYFHQFALANDDNYIYAAAENGKILKIDKISGDTQWKVSLDMDLGTGVSINDNYIYVAAIDGTLLALDKVSGKQAWQKKLSSEVVHPATVDNQHLIVGCSDGNVFALDPETGNQHWRYSTSQPSLTLRGNGGALIFDNFVVVGEANGKLAVLDIETGELRWEPKIAEPRGDSEIERIVDIDSTPIIIEKNMYAVSYQGQLVSLDLQTGTQQWSQDESSYRDITSASSSIFVSSSESVVTAYDKDSGKVKWAREEYLRRKITAPIPVKKYLLIGDFEGYVHVLAQSDGHTVARVEINGSGIKTSMLADGNRFYAIANDGKLKAYQIGE